MRQKVSIKYKALLFFIVGNSHFNFYLSESKWSGFTVGGFALLCFV